MYKTIAIAAALLIPSCAYNHSYADLDGTHEETAFVIDSPFDFLVNLLRPGSAIATGK